MKPEILNKISYELSSGIKTEKDTLYLLAEIRKYIDLCTKSEKKRYPHIYFYCNWVLHIEMDRTDAKNILNRFESHVLGDRSLDEISTLVKNQEKEFYSFVSLKAELEEFIKKNDLPIGLVGNSNSWYRFKKLLVEILIDIPLINKGRRISKFSYERGVDEQTTFRVDVNEIKRLGSFKITLKEK